MNKIFKYGLVVFIIFSLVFRKQDILFQQILQTPLQVFDITLTLVLSACLWNGLLSIVRASGLIGLLSFVLRPVLSWIYGGCINDDNIYNLLSANIIANLLGLGSLATISGLQAIKALHDNQTDKKFPGKEMMILVVMNTCGLSLIPTTIMTLRQSFSTNLSNDFFLYSILIGFTITIIGIVLIKVSDNHE